MKCNLPARNVRVIAITKKLRDGEDMRIITIYMTYLPTFFPLKNWVDRLPLNDKKTSKIIEPYSTFTLLYYLLYILEFMIKNLRMSILQK